MAPAISPPAGASRNQITLGCQCSGAMNSIARQQAVISVTIAA